jgi:AbrB family looped-hinge helix DNA binding protein
MACWVRWWYLNGMRTTIDAAGRVIIPKAIRDALGLVDGTPLEVELRDGAVILEPPPTAVKLVRRGRVFVAEPKERLPKLSAEQVRATLEAGRR